MLQIIHSSDNESSFQDPNSLEEKIVNYASVVRGLQKLARRERIPSLHVLAGDITIPGPFYQAASEVPRFGKPGLADIAIFNAMKIQGNGMGTLHALFNFFLTILIVSLVFNLLKLKFHIHRKPRVRRFEHGI